MHRPSAPFALAFTLLAFAPSALAQTVDTAPITLTLRDAMRRGAEDPPAVRLAIARADASRSQIDQARAGYLPSVSASGGASISFNDSPILAELRYQSTTVGLSAGVNARIPIYDFGRTANNVSAAEGSVTAAREDVRNARIQAMSQVASAYFTVLGDEEAVNAARATITQREAHLRIAEGLVNAGARPPIERTRAEINLDVARLDLTSADARERVDRTTLAAALGIDPLREVVLTPVDEEALRVDDDPARAADAAVASRPEFAGARARLAQAMSQADAARSGRLPSLSATAGASVNYSERIQGQGAFGVSENLQAGVSLSWPIFDPTVYANVRIADANVTSARETLAQQSLMVRTAAVQAAVNLHAASASLEQSQRLTTNAAANLEQATGRYQAGAAPLLELVDAQAEDTRARYNLVSARQRLQVARVNVLSATGEIGRMMR